MLDVLGDGLWHHRDQVLAAGIAMVPPGVAYRLGERDRQRQLESAPGGRDRIRGDQATAVTAGARHSARDILNGFVARGRVRRDGDRYQLAANPARRSATKA